MFTADLPLEHLQAQPDKVHERSCTTALGVAEIVEQVAAERVNDRLTRAGHGILGVDSFEEQANGAIRGTGVVALLLDDRAEHVGVLPSSAEVTTTRLSGGAASRYTAAATTAARPRLNSSRPRQEGLVTAREYDTMHLARTTRRGRVRRAEGSWRLTSD